MAAWSAWRRRRYAHRLDRAPRLDARGATVMPGLMDLHVHLVSVVDPDEPNAIWAEVSARTQLLTLHAAKNARLMLEGWFHHRARSGRPRQSAQPRGAGAPARGGDRARSGPRIFAAGWVGQTGGHSDLPLPDAWPRTNRCTPTGPGRCAGWSARRSGWGWTSSRRRRRAARPATRKSSGGGTTRPMSSPPSSTRRTRSASGWPSIATQPRPRSARSGPGVDTIEHGTELDEECLALFLEDGSVPRAHHFDPLRAGAGRARRRPGARRRRPQVPARRRGGRPVVPAGGRGRSADGARDGHLPIAPRLLGAERLRARGDGGPRPVGGAGAAGRRPGMPPRRWGRRTVWAPSSRAGWPTSSSSTASRTATCASSRILMRRPLVMQEGRVVVDRRT